MSIIVVSWLGVDMAQNVSIPNGDPEAQNNVVSVEGMDAFFDLSDPPHGDSGLTMKQAVHYYGLGSKVIRTKIKNGEIPAVRMDFGSKKKWRVYPGGVPDFYATGELAVPAAFSDDDPDLLPEWTEEVLPESIQVVTESYLDMAEANRELLERVRELESRLEAAAYRNGYLESQLDSTQEKLRCLTLRNQETHWWSGLARFFRR